MVNPSSKNVLKQFASTITLQCMQPGKLEDRMNIFHATTKRSRYICYIRKSRSVGDHPHHLNSKPPLKRKTGYVFQASEKKYCIPFVHQIQSIALRLQCMWPQLLGRCDRDHIQSSVGILVNLSMSLALDPLAERPSAMHLCLKFALVWRAM